jgi:hypothetical protein
MEGGAVGHKFEREPPRDHPFKNVNIFHPLFKNYKR